MIGTVLRERYLLSARVGAGAMGTVYKAGDLELQRTVAAKILRGRDDTAERRFLEREARALARLEHDNIVEILDYGRGEDGHVFLVMPMLDGQPLSKLLELCPLEAGATLPRSCEWLWPVMQAEPPGGPFLHLVVRWMAEIAGALRVMHADGLYHRDVKPSNIFITKDYRPILLDFGLAIGEGDSRLTATNFAVGTPAYLAPEVLRDKVEDPDRVDVYSLAATLYHAIGHEAPYKGTPDYVTDCVRRGIPPAPIEKLEPTVPRDLRAIIEHGMDFRPERRYASMAGLERDLRAFLDHAPVSVRPRPRIVNAWRRVHHARSRTVAAVAAVIIVALVAAIVPLWTAHAEQSRLARKRALTGTTPSLLTIEGDPVGRRGFPAEQRAADLAHVEEILALDPDDVLARLYRSALRLDSGDPAAAADDIAYLARTPDPYLEALVARYRQMTPDAELVSLGLNGLPAPEAPIALVVAAYHELRLKRKGRGGFDAANLAADYLTRAESAHPSAARNLRLIALFLRFDCCQNRAERDATIEELLALVDELEHDEGRSARTRSVLGFCRAAQRRYADAISPLRESIELRPGRHQTLQNLGVCLSRLHRYAEAADALASAEQVRPEATNTKYQLALVLWDQGDERGARDKAAELGNHWMRHYLEATFHKEQALAEFSSEEVDDDELREHTDAARASFDRAQEARGRHDNRIAKSYGLTVAIAQGNAESACAYLLDELHRDPMHPVYTKYVAELLPEDGLGRLLRGYFAALASAVKPTH